MFSLCLTKHYSKKVCGGREWKYGERYRCVDTSPTLADCLWFNALVVRWNTTHYELDATDADARLWSGLVTSSNCY
jgi:hypothetical protein